MAFVLLAAVSPIVAFGAGYFYGSSPTLVTPLPPQLLVEIKNGVVLKHREVLLQEIKDHQSESLKKVELLEKLDTEDQWMKELKAKLNTIRKAEVLGSDDKDVTEEEFSDNKKYD